MTIKADTIENYSPKKSTSQIIPSKTNSITTSITNKETTSYISTNNPSIIQSTSIITSIEFIPTQLSEIQTSYTLSQIIETRESINNDETFIVFLGINNFKMNSSFFSFCIYFISIKNIVYSKTLFLPIITTYNTNKRFLKEITGNCTLKEISYEIKYKYLCEVYEETKNIKQIKIIPQFDFASQKNIILKGITPVEIIYMDNIQSNNGEYDEIFNSRVYVLDNSTCNKSDKFLFNIYGKIKDPQPKFENKNLTLLVNLKSDIKKIGEVDCNINNNINQNYILNCKFYETALIDLQSSLSFIGEDAILLINFADINDSVINIEGNYNSNRYYRKNKSYTIGAGAIVGIILAIIALIGFAIFFIVYCLKKKKKSQFNTESSIRDLKIQEYTKEENINKSY